MQDVLVKIFPRAHQVVQSQQVDARKDMSEMALASECEIQRNKELRVVIKQIEDDNRQASQHASSLGCDGAR